MRFKLSLFGPPRLLDDHGKMIAVPAKTFSLIAYLLLTSRGEPATRASLRQFFWGSSDPKTAATNLRKFLWRVSRRQAEIGFALVHIQHDHVELAETLGRIDLASFQKIVSGADPADLVALCHVYRGDLLEGVEWEEAEFGNWLQVQRANLRDAFITAVASRLEPLDPDADKITARIAARRLIEVDPYNEVAHRTLMRLFADEGEPARVRDIYINLQQRLSEDLAVEPDAATTELHRTLLPSWIEDVATAPLAAEPNRVTASPILPAIVADAGLLTRGSGVAGPTGTPRITILPPATNGGQDLRHQLAGSLIEDVTIGLCRFKSLSVVAPYTASEFSASGNKDLASFGIDYSVETQIGIRAEESWLSVKLVDAATRRILWTDQYEFSPAQSARSYRSLSVRILSSLVERIERSELTRYDSDAQHPTSYHLYLAGQRFLRELDLPNIRRARRAFKSGLSINPEFVPALSGLARTQRLEWVLLARGDPDQLVEAERLSKRSVEIDPDDARGYRELGACTLYAGRFDESLEAFDQAETRNPQFADLLVDFGDALIHACEPALGIEKITRAIELNPLCPDQYWWAAGGANFHLHQYQDAIDCIQSMRDQAPAYRLLAASWARLGERERAADYVGKVMEIHPDFSVRSWLSIIPIRNPAYAQHYEQGLREAGFR